MRTKHDEIDADKSTITELECRSRFGEKRKTLNRLGAAGAISIASFWSKPVIKQVVLPAHAQTSGLIPSSVFMAQDYDIQFPNGGISNTTDCADGTVNEGRTLTSGVANFTATIGADGSFIAPELTLLTGTDTIENVISMDGSIDFNQTFNFTEPLLGPCETEVTIVGMASGTSISGTVTAEVRCEGCTSGFTTEFSAAPAS